MVLLSVLLAGALAASAEPPAAQLRRILEQDWAFLLEADPLFATEVGERQGIDRLPEAGPAAQLERYRHDRDVLEQLRSLDRERLGPEERLDVELLERFKNDAVAEYEFGSQLMPLTAGTGFHVALPQLCESAPLRSVADHEAYLARLRQVPRYFAQQTELLRAGVRRGLVVSREALHGWEAAFTPHLDEVPATDPLFAPFRALPADLPEAERARLTLEAERAIREAVAPAYRRLRAFLAEVYVPAARRSLGVGSLPGGKEFYVRRIRRYTTLELTPRAVHQLGLSEVARVREQMGQLLVQLEFRGTLDMFLEQLREDPRFRPKSAAELLAAAREALSRVEAALPRLFVQLPTTPYELRSVPAALAPGATAAYYEPPAQRGAPGIFYLNTFELESRPLFEIEALALHEAIPGHHLQLALQRERADLPAFRRYFTVPAFTEGWAVYAESLGSEAGLYADPYREFGRLSYAMWRASRLVVDTGIHAFHWSRRQARDFLASNTALSLHNIDIEVNRYVAQPGQALAYAYGERQIRELRALAERELGARFDLREFHTAVLRDGAVPLPVLEARVREWLAGRKHALSGERTSPPTPAAAPRAPG